MQASRPEGMQTEVFSYGRLPLAFSARCFTARHFNLSKDDCQFRCLEDPDGRLLSTREGKPFLALNGIQTLSAQIHDLSGVMPEIQALGVERVRLSPQSAHMAEVIEAFAWPSTATPTTVLFSKARARLHPWTVTGMENRG